MPMKIPLHPGEVLKDLCIEPLVVDDGKSEWLFDDSNRLNLQPFGQAPLPQNAQGADSTYND